MLSSDKEGEVLGAVAAIKRTLESVGLDLHDLAGSISGGDQDDDYDDDEAPPFPEMVRRLLACDRLSDWERKFINDLARVIYQKRQMTAAQIKKLIEIYGQRIGAP